MHFSFIKSGLICYPIFMIVSTVSARPLLNQNHDHKEISTYTVQNLDLDNHPTIEHFYIYNDDVTEPAFPFDLPGMEFMNLIPGGIF
ncbi:hypothetical protein BDF20DRAFT_860434 [Mycotypha africana]|uniref:uncharacterized protein n=1 Tax=Mycotypha africana TaxID=64632 RepID=UPI0022FFD7E1|nr:uncharacterized protein BDF20DRAFT_860434 [Mycotypha africana]KAI8984535.1 hypothetical protein BDF20DRAFT_860434 [Mycotypha africana]